jgi:hypothetical protein
MATQVKHRRGTNAEILAGTPAIGELWFNTTDNSIHMGDGVTPGGVKHARLKDVTIKDSDTISDALNRSDIEEGHVVLVSEITTGNGGFSYFDVVLTSSVTPDGIDIRQSTAIPTLSLKKRIVNRFGGVSLVYDDANQTVKDDLMPVSVSEDFKTSLAIYHSGMATSYDFVTMREALDFRKNVNGELLSHSMNSLVLNSAVDLTYGENLLKTSATEFSQFGFLPRGFVAPSSTLDAKFRPQLEQSFDFAFIRSVGAGAGITANNNFGDDRYNLTRIALTDSFGTEVITLNEAKAYVDQARAYEAYICFYAHTLPSYMTDLMQYIKDTYVVMNPSEWVGNYWGLNKDVSVKHQENLLVNSGFKLINADDTAPYKWSYNPNTLVTPTLNINDDEGGATIDLISGAGVGGETAILSQNYEFTKLNQLTPFCLSIYATSLASTNTDVKLALYAKDVSNVTIASVSKTFTVAGNRQRLEISQAFVPDANVVRILAEITIIAKGAGGVRAIMDSPQLERSGFATPYRLTKMNKYYSVLRRTTGLTVSPNTDTLINFNASLEGSNSIFDLATGNAKPNDGRNYLLQCNFGLQGMVAGDSIECHLLINGAPSRKAMFTAVAGTNILNPSWTLRGDGRTYAIGIRHNSAAGRSITTFADATMTVTSSEDQ